MATVLDELVDLAHLEIGHGLELKRSCTCLLDIVHEAVASHQAHATGHVLRVIDRADPVGHGMPLAFGACSII
jgi:hypothetical protein